MDTSDHYKMRALFEQLGLPAETEDISGFINANTLSQGERIEQASFWSAIQAAFIKESLLEDSDWTELIDHLDVLLRQK